MMRMKYSLFQFLLANIGKGITPSLKVGLKPISSAERLTLTLHFLATGESFRSLSYRKSGLHIPKSTLHEV